MIRILKIIIFNLLTSKKKPFSFFSTRLIRKNGIISYISANSSIKEILIGTSKHEIIQIKKLVELKKIKNSIFLDIGANIGIFSRNLNFFKKIYTFEPNKIIFKLLELNLSDYKNVKNYNIGLSEKNSFAYLKNSKNDITSNVIIKNKSKDLEKVKCSTLDSFLMSIKKDKSKIKVIKIDTEGHELNVLKGAKNFLKKYDPYIFFESEFNKKILFHDHQIIKFLKACGYKSFYRIKNSFFFKKNYFYLIDNNFRYNGVMSQILVSKNKI